MKKNIIAFCLLAFSLASCESALDVSPDGRKTLDEIFSTEIGTGAYLNSCYENFPQYFTSDYFNTSNTIGLTDDAYEFHTAQMALVDAYKDAVTPSNNKLALMGMNGSGRGDSYWAVMFRNIDRCNLFLERIGTAVVPSEQERNRWIAEARVLRAYYYLELMGRFGNVPIFTTSHKMSDDPSFLKKNTFKECVDFIQSECKDVIENAQDLPWRVVATNENGRMTKGIAAALMSRSILWLASPLWNEGHNYWNDAETVTKYALDKLLANGYELYDKSRNPSIFGNNAYFEYFCTKQDFSSAPNDKETILSSRFVAGNWWQVQGTMLNKCSKVGLCPTQQLVDAYPLKDGRYILNLEKPYSDEKSLVPNFNSESLKNINGVFYDENNPYVNRDPRFYATVLYNGAKIRDEKNKLVVLETYNGGNCGIRVGTQKYTCTGYHGRKYYHPNARKGGPAQQITYRVMRLAEMYLNFAEAAAMNGNVKEALEAVKPIRDRVGMINIPGGTNEEVVLQIRNERRIEMAYEEIRYYDIRRWLNPDDDIACLRYAGCMWIEKGKDGTFSYHRGQVGDVYHKDTDSWQGSGLDRLCYRGKYKLYPLEQTEADRLYLHTGVNWQNPGW